MHILPKEENGMLEVMQIIGLDKRFQFIKTRDEEMTLGTITNVKEVYVWLGHSYLFIRVRTNHLAHGIRWKEMVVDLTLSSKHRFLVLMMHILLNMRILSLEVEEKMS